MFKIRRLLEQRGEPPRGRAQSREIIISALCVAVGLISGLGAVLFTMVLTRTGAILQALDRAYLLPVFGSGARILIPITGTLIAAFLIWLFARHDRSQGISTVIEAIALRGGRLSSRPMLAKVLAAAIFIGSGGSAGSWTPSVQLGAVTGSQLGQWWRLSEERQRMLVASGIAGATAAAFNAPIAGVFFALEIVIGELSTSLFAFVVLAAVAASAVSHAILGSQPAFAVPPYTLVHAGVELPLYALLGIPAAIVGVLFIKSVYRIEDRLDHHSVPLFLRALSVGATVGLIGLVLPEVLGVGYDVVEAVLTGIQRESPRLAILLIVKLFLTALCVAGMGVGGTFAPSLFLGAMLGDLFGQIVHNLAPDYTAPPAAYALVGMGAVLTAVVRAPITAVLLLFEMTGDYRIILPLMFCIATTTLAAHSLFPESLDSGRLARRGIVLRFGRDLNIMELVRVGEAMSRDSPTLQTGTTLRQAADLFTAAHYQGLPVMNQQGELMGIITRQDISRALEQGHSDLTPVDEVMARDLAVAHPDQSLNDALRLFATHDVGRLPVVDRHNPRKLLGLLRRHDLARAYNLGLLRRTELEQRIQQMKLHSHSGAEIVELPVAPNSPLVGRALRNLPLPEDSLVVTVQRGSQSVLPRAETILQAGDRLICLAAPNVIDRLRSALTVEQVSDQEPKYQKLTISPRSPAAGRSIKELNLPVGTLLITIRRDNQMLVPRGETVLQSGDEVTLFGERDSLQQVVAGLFNPAPD